MLSGAWFPEDDLEVAFYEALMDLDPSSTPGICPLSVHGTTIGEILGYDPSDMMRYTNADMIECFKALVMERIEILKRGDLVFDPIKVFIKREPHKISKILDNRQRIISAVSMVDTMIDRILFRNFASWMKDEKDWPCYYGYTPLIGGYRTIKELFRGKTVLSTDKSSWDWTAQEWTIMACFHIMANKACFADDASEKIWRRVALSRFTALYRYATFRFADGQMIAQNKWGIQKSGCYLTLLLNSMSQWVLALQADPKLSKMTAYVAVGDDELREAPEDVEAYLAALEKSGCIVKDHHISGPDEPFEFCGFVYPRNGLPTPAYGPKHQFSLAHCRFGLEVATLTSYQIMYAFTPFLRTIQKALRLYSPDSITSKAGLRVIWDG
uniref:RdRp catalytic domain-containing protein n=1 Tax=Riboviria sp. TaxID=2585031 RepID=A0A8K1U3T2_9VIRU|nr:MAG: hypothetical protein 1 [Riboviria sp.]